jgi:hypothetical protein
MTSHYTGDTVTVDGVLNLALFHGKRLINGTLDWRLHVLTPNIKLKEVGQRGILNYTHIFASRKAISLELGP